MGKFQTKFVCRECGAEYLRWQGKCDGCLAWNSLEEFTAPQILSKSAKSITVGRSRARPINEIAASGKPRILSGIGELDQVFGGGIVPGSVLLLAGDPGIGKSTLVLQLCGELAKKIKVLYVSGEESEEQIKLRADRLKINSPNLILCSDFVLENIISQIEQIGPDFLIIDSVQVIVSPEVPSIAGSVSQVRFAAEKLIQIAKEKSIPLILIGHVTKEGSLAGPKTLEHLVDGVFYLEGERYGSFRILRSIKNRYGKTSEIGVFEMEEGGLIEVKNPSKLFLEERLPSPGSVISCATSGLRPILVEIQALVSPTNFGYPKRSATGIDLGRLLMLIAVLQSRMGLKLASQDIYVNVVGGMKISEPAIDLAVCLAILSAFKNKKIDPDLVCFGEVGLSGEVRGIGSIDKRIEEAEKIGFKKIVLPHQKIKDTKLKTFKVKSIKEAEDILSF